MTEEPPEARAGKLSSWAATDVGKKREHNEDSHLADDGLGLYIVADGMGGHQGGDRASRMAVDTLTKTLREAGDFEEAARTIVHEDPLGMAFPRDASVDVAITRERKAVSPPPDHERDGEVEGEVEGDMTDDFSLTDAPTDPSLVISPPAAATVLRAAARAAGRAIFDTAQAEPDLTGMGTTLTAILFDLRADAGGSNRAHLVHVGDSRAYLLRGNHISQLSDDHSWIAEQVRAGMLTEAEAKESKFKHIITRSVGFEREVDVDLVRIPVQSDDLFVLCSDGLSNHVGHDEIARVLREKGPAATPDALVALANKRGGDDNITVVVVRVN